MPPRRILIVYATNHGQTAKIAQRMADLMTTSGCSVTLERCKNIARGVTPRGFDGVVIGASINYGRHQRCVRRFVSTNRKTLNAMPTAFFSVSGTAAASDEASRAAARRYIDDFLRATGWSPDTAEAVAGAMAYSRYSPLMRWVIRRIAQKSGAPTDTSRDHEFTDWAQVQRFVEAFTSTIPRPPVAHPVGSG